MVQGIRAGMSTEPQTELQPVEENKKLLRSAVADEAIAEFALKVADLDATTDEGYEECKKAIRWCVKARSAVTSLKEELNRAALAHQRAVNAEEKRLIGLVSEVESQLKAKKQAVDDEVERNRKELEAKHKAWIVGRQDHFFAETGNLLPRALAEELSEPDYEAMVAAGREEKQKAALEAARIAQKDTEEKEAFRRAQAKLAAEKAEFERQQAEFKAAQELLARQQAEQAEREREAERKIERQRQQEERDAERKRLIIESSVDNKYNPDRLAIRSEPLELDYYDDGGQIAHQSVNAPMSNQDTAQVERAKMEAESDPVQPVAEAMASFLEFSCPGFPEAEDGQIAHQTVGIPGSVFASRIQTVDAPMSKEDMAQVEAMTNFRIDEASASREESVLAKVQESGEVDEEETVRKLIAPIHSEVMVRLVRMQNEAKALEAMFDDFEGHLMEYESMAADIRLAVEALQEEMDKYEPK